MMDKNKNYQIKATGLLICFCVSFIMIGCKTISIQNKQHFQTSQNITLGSIGIDENFILENTYSNIGLPKYFKPVKVNVIPTIFSKSTYAAYNKAKQSQNNLININYHDSLSIKPKFLSINISDRITLVSLLNHNQNRDVKDFLLNQNESQIVTSIAVVFNLENYDLLKDAEEVFIEQSGINNIAFKIYKESKLVDSINFNEGVVFSYRSASVCWKEDSKYQLEIVDLIEGDNSCPKEAYKSSKQAKKEINYYRF